MTDTASVVAERLRAAGCVFAEDEAVILLDAAAESTAALDGMVARRAAGEPLEQVVGWAEFCGLRILVDAGVFVPRRRSEFLVSVAVSEAMSGAMSLRRPLVIADLCCGTGALGLAVAAGLGGTRDGRAYELYAVDLDPAAAACARRNVGPAGGRVYGGDLFAALPLALRGGIDVLICNAPYVPSSDIEFMPAEAREYEARVALDGGDDGLAVLRRVTAQASGWLRDAGVLLVETSERQAQSMAAVMAAAALVPQVCSDDEYGATVVTGTRARHAGHQAG
jgi:release factor glutamine methyltransferase